MSTVTPKLRIESLTKSYGTTLAVRDVSFTVNEGEVLTVTGPSGCGKSTILNLLAGFEKPDSGRVEVSGHEVTQPGPDRSVVFQQHALFPWLTVLNNVLFGFTAAARKEAAGHASDYLEIMGLSGFADHYPHQLSGGMRQRVSIARALLRQPDVLLMDEPFGALDALTRLTMQDLLQRACEKFNPTIVFITHDVDEAILLSNRVMVLNARPGSVKRVLDVPFPRPRSYEVMTSSAFAQLKEAVLRDLHPEGWNTPTAPAAQVRS